MGFVDTLPGALGQRGGTAAASAEARSVWAQFRVHDERQRRATLRELWQAGVPLTLGAASGALHTATLWSVDEQRQRLHFSIQSDPANQPDQPLAPRGLWAAGYLGPVKVQFPLDDFEVRRAAGQWVASCLLPERLYRMHRRQGVRIRRSELDAMRVSLRSPLAPDLAVQLRVLDIGALGCGLWRPAGELPMVPEQVLREVEFIDDGETLFFADLEVRHVSLEAGQRHGVRVGCRWRTLSRPAQAALDEWIRTGERRRSRFTLSLD
jgi:hypothetical protein